MRLYGSISGLGQHHKALAEFAEANEHSDITFTDGPMGTRFWHWEVCDRKLPFGNSLGQTHKILTQIYENYGERARAADANDGIDWKAMSHALRVGTQSIELVDTGYVTFPRPDARLLLSIKNGEMPFRKVADILEATVDTLRFSAGRSSLPDTIDRDLAKDMILHYYSNQVFQTDPEKLGWAKPKPEDLLGVPVFATPSSQDLMMV